MTTILHLEDDGPLRDILAKAVKNTAPDIVLEQFTTSNQVLAYLEDHIMSVDLFILDIRVNGEMDGLELSQKIREMGSHRPIIITSAYIKPQPTKLRELNARWMAKPWHILELADTIIPLAISKL